MTPQQLMDLPNAGMANKHVKAMGMWLETMTDTERIEWIEEYGVTVQADELADEFTITPTGYEICYDTVRPAIDAAATKKTASLYRAYLEDLE